MTESIHPSYDQSPRLSLPVPGSFIGRNAGRLVGHPGAIVAVVKPQNNVNNNDFCYYYFDPGFKIRSKTTRHFIWTEKPPDNIYEFPCWAEIQLKPLYETNDYDALGNDPALD